MDIQSVGFLAKEKELLSPHPTLVDEAFRTLSPQGTLTITCRPTEVGALLLAAERAGFRSMRVDRTEGLKILAHKSGPQGSGYRGPAAAAMDDEGRLMLNAVDPAKPGSDPFLEDAKRLLPWLGLPAGTKDRVVVFYPGPFKLLKLASDGLFSFSIVPLRAAAMLGLIAILLSAAFSLYTLYAKLFLDRAPAGFTSLMLFMSFLTGVQLFFLGIIGEYIGRIYQETKRRPLYVVGSVVKHGAGMPVETHRFVTPQYTPVVPAIRTGP